MQEEYARIGISGGTFDPIHYGHLIMAEEIRDTFNLDKVVFVPTGRPPHKVISKISDVEHRYNMVCSAVSTNPDFSVSRIEMEGEGYVYTVDTITRLKNLYGNSTKLFFIIGADIVWDLPKWKDPMRLFSLCEFIVAFRPGYNRVEFEKEVDRLRKEYNAQISMADTPAIDISSTDIRERIHDNRSIRYLVPESVEEYIRKNGLYR